MKSAEDLVEIDQLSIVGLVDALRDFREQPLASHQRDLVTLFEEQQRFLNDLADGFIQSGLDLPANQLFQCGRDGDVHGVWSIGT